MRATLHNLAARWQDKLPAIANLKRKNSQMTKLNRLFASTLLIASMSAVAIADGGNTQGPSIYSDGSTVAVPEADRTEQSSQILDALKTAESVAIWFLTEVL
jgi:hypothetical protein